MVENGLDWVLISSSLRIDIRQAREIAGVFSNIDKINC